MQYEFCDIVNIPLLQDMAEKLYIAAGIPIGIIDLDGNIAVQAGWQSICTEYHRANPESCKNCKISDQYVFEHLHEKKFVEYKCLNGMWDIAMPIIIEGRHVATLFVGQFFYPEDVIDYEIFEKQAEKFGFDTEKYIAALKKVPIFTKERVHSMLDYYQNYITVLAESGMKTLQKQSYISKIQQYADIVAEMKSGLLVFNLNGFNNLVLQSANKAAYELLDFKPDSMIGRRINEILPNLSKNIVDRYIGIAAKIEKNDFVELCYLDERQNKTWFSFNAFSIPENCLGVMFDNITDRKTSEGEITYLSYHDQLTGLYNRRYFEAELKRSDILKNYPLAIIMADVNGLKVANDSYGHYLGDQLLIAVADSLRYCCGEDKVIARLGGDEFVILLPNTDLKSAESLIEIIVNYNRNKTVGPVNVSVAFGAATKDDDNEGINETLRRAEDRMYMMKILERPSIRSNIIFSIIAALHEKNPWEKLHSDKVSDICVNFGYALDMSESEINELRTAALLHDVGKIGIDENILNQREQLTKEDIEEIKRHSELGYRILRGSQETKTISNYVLHHHERWDGMGYPEGLSKNEIPLQSRIIAIAEAFDAITRDRIYSKARCEADAALELERCAGTQFDPELVKIFIDKVINGENQ
ncbi:MAG: PocR ligand-binding domain-containing protein [Solirubrobacterales bacterium]